MKTSRLFAAFAWALLMLFALGLRAETAAEPTVHQIYQAADRGDLRGARSMIDEVLARHPKSGKAHYVKAELAARGGDAATARSELQQAEKLAPGLPFAKPEAVSALRSQVDKLAARAPAPRPAPMPPDARRVSGPPAGAGGGGFPFGALLVGIVLVVGVVLLLRRRRAAQAPTLPARGPFTRDDAFGRGPLYGPGGQPATPQQAGYGGYPAQPAQGGMGSTIAGGLAAGLAMGAGAVAAQEIGRRMFDHGQDGRHLQDPSAGGVPPHDPQSQSPLARDAGIGAFDPASSYDMGGQDFGIADDGGWDDAGAADAGGGDWDT